EETLMLMAKVDENNFVRIHYEIEEDERVFNYFVKEDGIVTRTKVKVEEENDGIKVQLSFVEGTAKGNYSFKMSTDDDGVEVIKVKYTLRLDNEKTEEGHIHIYVTINEETGEVVYDYKLFDNGNKLKNEMKKHRRGHHGEVPEDFQGGNDQDNGSGNTNGGKRF
ncbi:MAG: hypothetical protein PHQ79_05405, partial [Bacilli bacterium]|nr:hypothetical protein [Bacilli bacterium]